MRVRIRLMNQGVRNHPFWWLIVQPANKNPRGRYLEKVGYWLPRKTQTVQRAMIINKQRIQYWLSVGATCTNRVHKVLEKFNFVPPYPVPFGSKSLYEKPEKEYKMDYFKRKAPKGNNRHHYYKQQLQEQINILERKKRLQYEAQANLGEGAAIANLDEMKTTDIDSEDPDIFERKTKFEALLKRMEKHRKENAHLKGNDLRYNIYMKKLQKLTRMDLGLDLEAYKDFVNNLKLFAGLNEDFEIYARDQLKLTDEAPEYREMIKFYTPQGEVAMTMEQAARLRIDGNDLYNTLMKLRREASGFLQKRDKELLKDFINDFRKYMTSYDIYTLTKEIYDKKKQEIADRQNLLKNSTKIDFSKVTDRDLENAGVSLREYNQIQMLIKIDEDLFKPSEFGEFTPHSMIVDVGKYADMNLSQDAKEILFRPPKVKNLYVKYWQLAKVCEGKTKEENDRKTLKEHHPRYPKKSAEEIMFIDQIISKIDELAAQDLRQIEQEIKKGEAASTELESELQDYKKGLYYEGAVKEAIDKWRSLPEEEKAKQRKGDEYDEVNTTDIENDDLDETYPYEFFSRHRINLARAFLGFDGGYSIRKLKKIYKREKQYQQAQKEAMRKRWQDKQDAAEGIVHEEVKEPTSEPASKVVDSDESTWEDSVQIDDETYQKLLEELQAQNFKTEEDAMAYFDKYLKERFSKLKRKKRKEVVDEREKVDPYYAMLKQEKPINSRYANEFDLDDDDYHRYFDQREKTIARYPIGYRHYESYENYKVVNPDATLKDYADDMNRQCEYEEFRDIMKQGFLQESQHPYFRWKYRIPNDPVNPEQQLSVEAFVDSQIFEEEMRIEYQKRIQSYLLDRQWYKLVDALAEVTNYWSYGRDFTTMPTYNVYVPTRHHIMNKPSMLDDSNDDVSYRYNLNRMSPYQYLNSLKGYKMMPPAGFEPKPDPTKPKWAKWRRLSRPKMFGFSTINTRPAEGAPNAGLWYQTNFNRGAFGFNTFTQYSSGIKK